MKLKLLFLISIFFISGCISQEEEVFVSNVIDGDTLEISTGSIVRLIGIDTPEKNQPYYTEAKEKLTELIENKKVILERDKGDVDSYGRLLRYIYVDDVFVNKKLVKEGYAIVSIVPPNSKYKNELELAEKEAKYLGLRIWPESDDCVDCVQLIEIKWDAEGNDCENLNGEYVIFKNVCDYDCDLTSWTLSDKSSNKYTFKDFILYSNSEMTIYSGKGENNKEDLYWNNNKKGCNAIWNNNFDTLFLRNAKGELIVVERYLA